MDRELIYNSVLSQQRCQRNWDLSKTIPQEDIELMVHAATKAPSKQNICDFQLAVVTDRNLIQQIYDNSHEENNERTNPQVLANVLFCFIKTPDNVTELKHSPWHTHSRISKNDISGKTLQIFEVIQKLNINIAAGNLSLVANMLGYKTGFCRATNYFTENNIFTKNEIKKYFGLEVIVGVGYPNDNLQRTQHHLDSSINIESYDKTPGIKVERY